MKEQEFIVLDNLAAAYSNFIELPITHPDKQGEFAAKIHELQHLVMARLAVRQHPEYFTKATNCV